MLRWALLFVLFVVRGETSHEMPDDTYSEVCGSCATKEFMPCVVQLNTQKVPFDTNIMHVIYNITTEAKLIHTCRSLFFLAFRQSSFESLRKSISLFCSTNSFLWNEGTTQHAGQGKKNSSLSLCTVLPAGFNTRNLVELLISETKDLPKIESMYPISVEAANGF